jgi:hypothetical protein
MGYSLTSGGQYNAEEYESRIEAFLGLGSLLEPISKLK